MENLYTLYTDTPIGTIAAIATNEALLEVDFVQNSSIESRPNRILEDLHLQLNEYFSGKRINFDIPIKPRGTNFQIMVWNAIIQIQYGKTISYSEQAKMIGQPGAYRAVANANGANPISIIIPCHRIVKKDGRVGGYTGGAWKKEFLLNLEKKIVCNNTILVG